MGGGVSEALDWLRRNDGTDPTDECAADFPHLRCESCNVALAHTRPYEAVDCDECGAQYLAIPSYLCDCGFEVNAFTEASHVETPACDAWRANPADPLLF